MKRREFIQGVAGTSLVPFTGFSGILSAESEKTIPTAKTNRSSRILFKMPEEFVSGNIRVNVPDDLRWFWKDFPHRRMVDTSSDVQPYGLAGTMRIPLRVLHMATEVYKMENSFATIIKNRKYYEDGFVKYPTHWIDMPFEKNKYAKIFWFLNG